MTSTVIRMDSALVDHARSTGEILGRSTSAQLAHWARLGRAIEDVGLTSSHVQALLVEQRRYDDRDRILETDYRFNGTFTDITLTSTKPWRDLYHYDKESGALTGWTREEEGKAPVEFDAGGRLLQEGGARPVRYEIDATTHRLLQKTSE